MIEAIKNSKWWFYIPYICYFNKPLKNMNKWMMEPMKPKSIVNRFYFLTYLEYINIIYTLIFIYIYVKNY